MKKNIIIWILIITSILLISRVIFDFFEKDTLIANYEVKAASLKMDYDSLGRETVKLKGDLVSERTLKEANIKELDKFKKELKKAKNLVAYYNIQTDIKDTIYIKDIEEKLIYVKDSITGDSTQTKVYNFNFDDEWTKINGSLSPDSNSVELNYSVDAGVEILHAWKRPGFLKRKVPEITIKFNNPNIRTNEVKTVIKRKKRGFFRWLLGIK